MESPAEQPVEKRANQRKLDRLCRRHGVPLAIGARLLPLLERAEQSNADVRRKLIAVIEATLACDADAIRRREEQEQRYLIAVAAALHAW